MSTSARHGDQIRGCLPQRDTVTMSTAARQGSELVTRVHLKRDMSVPHVSLEVDTGKRRTGCRCLAETDMCNHGRKHSGAAQGILGQTSNQTILPWGVFLVPQRAESWSTR